MRNGETKMKKLIVVIMGVSILFLSGCSMAEEPSYYEEEYYDGEFSEEDSKIEDPAPEVNQPENQGGNTSVLSNSDTPAQLNRKIIYRASLAMKVVDPSVTYNEITDTIGDYTAYVEEADISQDRYDITVRVLSSEFDQFVEDIKTSGELVSYSKTSDDITNQYSTFEAKRLALETKHARILELITQADDLNTILMLEEERYDIESSLNAIGNTLENYDSLVDYSTVEISIREAVEEIIVLPRTENPNVSITETTNNSISLEIYNKDESNATIHVDLYQNGEFIEEYEEDTFAESVVEVTFDELDSNKEYTVKVTALSSEHRISLQEVRVTETEKTYGNRITNTFVESVSMVVMLFEYVGLALSGLIPFAVLFTVFFVPFRFISKRYKGKTALVEADKEL